MPTTDQLQFEMQRRVILFNSGTTMPDNSVLGYEGNPNYASTATPGQTLLYSSPRGTSYIELVNGNLWYKQQIPNTWINLTSGTQSGTASTSSQNNVVYTTGNQDISGVKNFYSRPTVNGSGVLLIGETGSVVLPNTLVYTTGDQTINGLKDFTTRPTVNTIPVLLSGEVNTTISGVLYSAQINIKNNNGSTIYRGQPVYVSSAAGSNILVKLASNSGEQTSSKTLGLVYQTSLAQNGQGTIVTEGILGGLNTNAGEEGDPIWLGPTGSLIFGLANKPYAPNHLVYLGVLTRKQANQGEIFVKIQNGFELEELHNVNINHRNTLADKNIIRYDSLSGIWFNDTIDSVLPNSIVYITGNQTISGTKTFADNTIFENSITTKTINSPVNDNLLISGSSNSMVAGDVNITPGRATSYGGLGKINLTAAGDQTQGDINLKGSINLKGNIDVNNFGVNITEGSANTFKIYKSGLNEYNQSTSIKSFEVNQSGVFTFNKTPIYSDALIYISGNQVVTGSVQLNSYATAANLALTGSNLSDNINSLSGLFTTYTGNLDTTFASDIQLFNTGSTLNNKINALSGFITGLTGTFGILQANLYSTGSTLDTKINSLSGYVNVQDVIFSGQTSNTGSRLDNKINSLSGYVDSKSITLPSTIVYTTGNQTISGNKNFVENVTFGDQAQDDLLVISGNEISFGVYPTINGTGIVYNQGDQIISGNKTFDVFPVVSGNKLITGVNLSSYATNVNLDSKINSLSGYINSQDIIFSGQIASTGSNLNDRISLLNTLFTGYTGSLDASFATDAQLFATGSVLNDKINSLSGYVNSQDVIFSGQTFNTGSRLDNKINSLSGYVNSQDIIFSGQIDSTGSILDKKINSLSGYVNAQSTSGQVFNTGSVLDNKINTLSGYVNSQDSIFSGQTFNTGSRLDNKINSLSGYVNSQDTLFSGQIALTGSNLYNSIVFLSGLFTGYTGSLDANFATDAQLFSTGSILDNKINSLSGYVTGITGTFGTLPASLYATGSTLDNKINSLSGVSVLTFSDQNIYGNKTFFNNIEVSGTGIFQNINIINLNELVISGAKIIIGGNSGVYSYSNIYISGNQVLTGVDLSYYATNINLFTTGSTLDDKINSLSGYVDYKDILISGQILSTGSILDNKINALSGYVTGITGTFGSLPTNLVLTGSTLDSKINSLSGYVNSQDVIFSGQTFNTGSRLDNKINSLSGYINAQDIIFSGQIALTGSNLYNSILSLSGLFTGYTGSLDANFASDAQLFTTGSTLDNKINSLSGYVNYQDTIFSGQTFNTGSRLDNKINSLSGYVDSKDIIFSGQIASTGSSLYNSIISLSGYVNSQSTSGQVFNTGSLLDNKINSLSGYVNSQDVIFSGQTASTGSRLDSKINSLSGYVDSKSITLPSTIVYTTGNQTISGNKNFVENVTFGDQNQDDLLVISGNEISFGVYPTVNGTGIVYTQGNQTISGVKSFSDQIKFLPQGATYPFFPTISGRSSNDGEAELDIDAFKLNLRAGYAKTEYIELGGEEGRLNINTVADTSTFNLGYNHNSSSTGIFNITSSSINLYGQVNGQTGTFEKFYANNLVYNTGDQTISGIKTFNVFPVVSGNKLITGIDTSSFASTSNLFATGSILDNKINALSGYVSGISAGGSLPNSIVYTTGNQLISGNKIFLNNISVSGTGNFNNVRVSSIDKLFLSGIDILITGNSSINVYNPVYISGNPVLTGVDLSSYATISNLISTGSILDNKINALSGYVSGISLGGLLPSTIVYTTGNQLISGNKTFLNNVNISGTGNFNNVKVSSIDKLFLSGIDMVITGNSSINVYNAIYISGNPVLTGVIPTAQTITDVVYTTGDQTIQGTKTFEVGNPNSKVIISGSDAFAYALSVVNTSNQGNGLFLKKGSNPGGGAVSENFVIKAVDRTEDLIFTLKSTQAGTNSAGFFCDPDGVNDAGGPNVIADSVVISGRTYIIGEGNNQLQYILSDSNSIQAVNPFYSYTGGLFFDNNGFNLKFVDKNGNYPQLNPIEVTSGNDVFINGNSSFGIYQQGTLYPNGIPFENSSSTLTRSLNSLDFYYGIVSGTNFTNGLKPGNLLYYTTKSSANYANMSTDRSRVRIKTRPYMVVDEASNHSNSYTVNTSAINPGNNGNFSFLKFNNNSQYSGLAIKQLIFNPTIQNAYRNYDLARGVGITVKPKNIHLETFIDLNVKSGSYWSKQNLGIERYLYGILVETPKATNFTQAHVLNFKLNFERDDRVTRVANYTNRVVTIFNPATIPIVAITGYDFQFSQKLRLILNTDGSLKEW